MSLFKKSFVAIAFALSAQAHAIELAPLDLAIQHFNAQHSKPLALWSAEHQFMVQALSAVEKNHPEVMTHPEGGKGIALFNPQERQFKALVAEIYLSKKHPDATQEALQKEVDAEVTKLISTCGWSKETHTSETSNSTSKRIRTTQTYSLNYGPCEKLPSSSEATRLGLVSVTVDKTESPYGDSYVYSVDSQSYQDMVFVRNQLAKSANWQVLAKYINNAPQMLIGGDAASIRVSTTSGVATFTDKFEVEINFGWGDCPAGCISHQTYVVAIEPVLKADGTYEFNTVVTKSEGNGGVIF